MDKQTIILFYFKQAQINIIIKHKKIKEKGDLGETFFNKHSTFGFFFR